MPDALDILFKDESGQLIVVNLFAATQEDIIDKSIARAFIEDLQANVDRKRKKHLPKSGGYAIDVVFSKNHKFQLVGPKIRTPVRSVINIQPLSKVHFLLRARYNPDQVSPVRDIEAMLNEVRNFAAAHPEDEFGVPERPFWLAERDEETEKHIEWLLTAERPTSDEAAERLQYLLFYFGLPIYADTNYLLTEFKIDDWGARTNEGTYRRPTVFDGVDGDYFKQHRFLVCREEAQWNKTIDLLALTLDGSGLKDGAWEAVGRPLAMSRISRMCRAKSGPQAKPLGQKIYVEYIRALLEQQGIWGRLTEILAST